MPDAKEQFIKNDDEESPSKNKDGIVKKA